MCGESLDDSQVIVMLYRRELERETTGAAPSHQPAEQLDDVARTVETRAEAPKPAHAIHITTCRDCGRGWQNGSGVPFEVDAATLERMHCDATVLRRRSRQTAHADHSCSDSPSRVRPRRVALSCARVPRSARPRRASHQVPGAWRRPRSQEPRRSLFGPSLAASQRALEDRRNRTRRVAVRARWAGTSRGSSRQERGNDPRRHSHRRARSRPADARDRTIGCWPTPGAPPRSREPRHTICPWSENAELARKALVQSGYKAAIAERAVNEACAHVDADADLVTLIKEAFRRCL